MADVGVRVTYEGDEAARKIAELGKQIADLEKQAQAPIKTLGDLDKAIASILELQKKGAINAHDAERRAQALGDQYKYLTEGVLPKSVKGLEDLSRALGQAAASAAGLTGYERTIRQTTDALEGVGGMSGRTALAIAGIGAAAAVAGGVIVSKFLEGFNAVYELGQEFNNLSQRTGIAVEKLSGGLRLAAETSGSSVEALAHGVNMLNRSISEAADGTGRQADAFKRLGIEVKDANGNIKSSDRILEEIAESFKSSADGATKTEIAMTLLGRAGANLIPLLNQGASGLRQLQKEAELAGIVMDKETAEAANKLNENLRVLKAYGEGFWMSIASPMVEGLRKITDAMRDARKEGESWIGSMMAGAGQAVSMLGISFPGQRLEARRDVAISQMTTREKLLQNARARGDVNQVRQLELEIESFRAERDSLNAQIVATRPNLDRGEFGGQTVPGPLASLSSPTPKAGREQTNAQIVSEYLTYYENLVKAGEMSRDQQLALLDEMAVEFKEHEDERVRIVSEAAEIRKKIAHDEQKFAESVAKAEQQVEEESARVTKEAWGFVFAQRKKDLEESMRTNDRAAQAEMRQINETVYLFKNDKLQALEALRAKYEDMGADGKKALERVKGEMEALKGTTKATGVIVQEAGIDMGRVWQGVHQGLVTSFTEIGKWALGISSSVKNLGDAIKSFFVSIATSIIEMFAKIAANKVFEWIFGGGSLAGASGAASGAVSGAVSGASQGFFGSLFGGKGGGGGGVGAGLPFPSPGSFMNWLTGGPSGADYATLGVGVTPFGGSAGLGSADLGAFYGDLGSGAGAGAGIWGAGGVAAIYGVMNMFDPIDKVSPWDPAAKSVWDKYVMASYSPSSEAYKIANGLMSMPDNLRNINALHHLFPSDFVGMSTSDVALLQAYNELHDMGYVDKVYGIRYATGGEVIATSPRAIIVGDVPERVDIRPLAGSTARERNGVTIMVSGLSLLDNYAARKLAYELARVQRG